MDITLICADEDSWALGLRSISAVLKEAGHRTRLIFAGPVNDSLNGSSLEHIRSLAEGYDLIGVSSMSRGSRRAKAIIEALRPLAKPIVWGGMHPTLYPEDCVGHADLVCRGEGEEFMLELAGRLASGCDFHDMGNAAYLDQGRMVLNDVRPLIGDLDRLPKPDFSFEEEFRMNGQGNALRHLATNDASLIMLTGSRGCACNCHYCSNSQLKVLYEGKGRYIRKMSMARFVESAAARREKFPNARYFFFTDEDFFARPVQDFREFADLYPKRVGLPFECMTSPQQVTEEKMTLLTRAGLWRVDVGVESGSDRVKREVFNRAGTNDIVERAAGILDRYPQVVRYYFFIIGNPYEERQDLLETISLLRRLKPPYFLRTYNLVFIPGTILFQKACRDGIIKGLEDSAYEMDFIGGLATEGHAWKQDNLYLNCLISLMTGKSTRSRLGFVPKSAVPFLIRPCFTDLMDRYPAFSRSMIKVAQGGLRARRKGLELASIFLKNPRAAYGFKLGRKKTQSSEIR